MVQSTYDPCLLYKTKPFGIVGLQTDDTLILGDEAFAVAEEDAIKSAGIMTKERDQLATARPIKFNGTRIELDTYGNTLLYQETQVGAGGIQLVKNFNAPTIGSQGVVRA